MNRRLRREQSREKTEKVFTMTINDIKDLEDKLKSKMRSDMEKHLQEISENILKNLLVIPLNVLLEDEWKDLSEEELKEHTMNLLESVLSLYKSYVGNTVNMDDMLAYLSDKTGVRLEKFLE